MAPTSASGWDRFWGLMSVAARTDDCVAWNGHITGNGYGQFQRNGRKYGPHRLALQVVSGRQGTGLLATHGPCANPLCINAFANHLTWGSHADNSHDRRRDGTHLFGERHPRARLRRCDFETIRSRNKQGERQVDIAKDYGVSQQTISNVITRINWYGQEVA